MFDIKSEDSRMWDREEVRIRIKQLYRLGRDISYSGVLEDYPHLVFAAVHYFRNWSHAVTACGIDYKKVRRNQVWNKKKITQKLIKHQAKGEDLSYNKFQKSHPGLFHAAQYQFGSWESALSSIGIKKVRKSPGRTWSKKKVSSRIKELNRKGIDLSFRAMFKQGYGVVVSMGSFYCGSWRRAIEQAGLDYDKIKRRPGPLKGYRRKRLEAQLCPA